MKVLALVTVLVLLVVAVPHAQDLGIPDTVRIECDTLRVGVSMPVRVAITNDYLMDAFQFGLVSKSLDGGFAVADSFHFVNRMASGQVLNFRTTVLRDNDGLSPDMALTQAMGGYALPVGNDAVFELWLTGLTPGHMVVDSGFFPPVGEFVLVPEHSSRHGQYPPVVVIDTIAVVEGGLPPVLTLPDDDPRVVVGTEVVFDVTAESPMGYPVEIALVDFSHLETGGWTPINSPELTDDDPAQFSWQTTSSDVELWSATFSACDTAGVCATKSATIQVVSDQSYILSFETTETQDAPEVIQMTLGNSDSDPEPELFITSYGHLTPASATLMDLSEELTYETVWTFPHLYSVRGSVSGYLDDDDNIDFLMTSNTMNCAWPLYGDGNNDLTIDTVNTSFNSYGSGAVLGEFTGDQYLDFVAVNYYGVWMLRGGDDPPFEPISPVALVGPPLSLNSADFDDDGLDDLAVGTTDGLAIYLSDGLGGFVLNETHTQTYGSVDIEITNKGSDFNNDNYYDLCLATPSVSGTHSELVVYLGNGDGTFQKSVIRTPLGHIMANCAGDFNNDGDLDIAYVNGSEQYCAILFGDGNGSFTNELRFPIKRYQPKRIVSFDADSDGDLDLVVASTQNYIGASLFLLENQLDPEGFSAMPVLITAEDNAELFLTSPSGQVVNKVRSSIASGEYQRRNSNQNNLLDDAISFNTVEAGVYTIAASPKPGVAKAVQTFSLEITFGTTSYRFAENSVMAAGGYEFNLYPSGGSPVSPPPGTWVYTDSPTLSWQGSGSFDVQLATDIEFANIIATATVDQNSYQVSPLDASVADLYYWRVKPVAQSEYETLYPFNLPECPTPAPPTLELPTDGATDIPLPVTWDWSDVSEATQYHLQVDNDNSDFNNLVVDNDGRITSDFTWDGLADGTDYWWRVRSGNDCGWGDWSLVWTFSVDEQTDVREIPSHTLPKEFHLSQNYPNPFNPVTNIDFALPRAAHVRLEVFNILGGKVCTLVDEYLSPGYKSVEWDGRSNSGQAASSGVYLFRFTADEFSANRKVLLMK